MIRARRRPAQLLCLAALGATMSTPALSQERLIMPYACEARGREVNLFRAPERSYPIYGARDQQVFRYCPASTPGRCRHWMVHRFEVDCGGVRVPWMKVAEA